MSTTASIYLARHRESGKPYIGFTTVGLEERKAQHERSAKRGSQSVFHKALRKYGADAFHWTVLNETDDIPRAKDVLENRYISRYRARLPLGFNMTEGGEGVVGYEPTEEVKQRISKTLSGRKRKPFAEEHRRRLSEAAKGRVPHNKGKKASLETRQRLSEAHKGYTLTDQHKQRISSSVKKSWEKRRADG